MAHGSDSNEASPSGEQSELEDLVGPFYDPDGLSALLQIAPEAIGARGLLRLRTGDSTTVYPTWQFTPAGDVIPHLTDVLDALAVGSDDPWTWALWLTAPDDEWDGRPAWRWLADGADPTPVLLEAQRDAARWLT